VNSPYDGFEPAAELPGERTRTIWEGRCPTCGENSCVPDPSNRALYMSRWCKKCERAVPCERVSYAGPELEPMPPNEHHVWCNGDPRAPVKGCRWCCRLDKTGHWDGFWIRYPYDPATGPPENFAKMHFPGVKVRR